MNHQANHQDWEQVVLKKPAHLVPGAKKGGCGGPKPPQEGDEFKLPKIGNNLKVAMMQARVAKKMSQKDFAQKLGVPTDIVNKYETGKIVPNNNFIAKMERVLGAKLPRAIKPKK
jgi:putative transcription factor